MFSYITALLYVYMFDRANPIQINDMNKLTKRCRSICNHQIRMLFHNLS